jgi:hypothetical protein
MNLSRRMVVSIVRTSLAGVLTALAACGPGGEQVAGQPEWTKVGGDHKGASYWVDASSLQATEAGTRQAVAKVRLPPEIGYQSARVRHEVDCAGETIRSLEVTLFRGPDLDGESSDGGSEPWETPESSSNGYAILRFICDGPLER